MSVKLIQNRSPQPSAICYVIVYIFLVMSWTCQIVQILNGIKIATFVAKLNLRTWNAMCVNYTTKKKKQVPQELTLAVNFVQNRQLSGFHIYTFIVICRI